MKNKAFLFLIFLFLASGAFAQEEKDLQIPTDAVFNTLDKSETALKGIVEKIGFFKTIWEKVVSAYEKVKSVFVGIWDKYLDKYLGKYVEVIKSNIKQGIEEEKQEFDDLFGTVKE